MPQMEHKTFWIYHFISSHHQLQDALRMAYPPHHWEWIHPLQAFWHIKLSSAAGRTENGLRNPSLRMDTPISGVLTYLAIIISRSHWEWLTHPIFSASCSWWWFNMSKHLKWVHPFSVMGLVSHSPCVLQLMMTYHVISILWLLSNIV